MKFWRHYHYKNLTLVGLSVVLAFILFEIPAFRAALLSLGSWGYLGAFFAGILFVSTFTVSIGTVILLILAQNHLSAFEIAIFAGIGGVVGDFIIFQSIRSHGFVDEIKNVFEFMGGEKIEHLLKTKYFSWTLPVIGAFIIASPFPDELGVSIMGISRMKTGRFLLLALVLDFLGVFLVVSAAKIF